MNASCSMPHIRSGSTMSHSNGGCCRTASPAPAQSFLLQFSDRLRRRFLTLDRTTGAIYVTSAFILAPLGAYIQYLDEGQGAARSFTVETIVQATLLMTTTGMGLFFALKRMITPHRWWMIRSYAVALTFLEIR